MTKSAEIRKLLREGLSRSAVAHRLGVSYQFVYQIDRRVDRSTIRPQVQLGKPFAKGTRVVHKRQVDKTSYGVVMSSNGRYTHVAFTYRHPDPQHHYCRFYEGVPCIHKKSMEGKLLPPVILNTVDLEKG